MLRIPDALRTDHQRLHARLAAATRLPGRTGKTARSVAKTMHPHFLREDEYAMPPLGLLARLARGHLTPELTAVLPLVARVKDELPLMLEEHRAVEGALIQFANVAIEEGQPEWADFAEDLRLYARMEEEVLYPAAVLVGEYVKSQLQPEGVK